MEKDKSKEQLKDKKGKVKPKTTLSDKKTERAKSRKPDKDKNSKDSDKPKKGLSGYNLFCMEQRPQVRKDLPDLIPKDIISELAKRWKESDDSVKEKYNNIAKEKKEESVEKQVKKKVDSKPKKEEKEKKQRKKGKTAEESDEDD